MELLIFELMEASGDLSENNVFPALFCFCLIRAYLINI